MDYTFRPAAATDLGLVWRGELAYMRAIEPEHEQRWLAATDRHLDLWTANLDNAVVAEADGQPAGYEIWMADGNQAVLATIHVLTRHRRQGLGGQLLARFVEDARSADFTVLALSVKDDNPAVRLYEHYGFTRGDDRDGYRTYAMRLE
jgi:ribosomal-protein-alanine N-acetyltransferase